MRQGRRIGLGWAASCSVILLAGWAAHAVAQTASPDAQTAKPWTRWWWPGSAVEPAGITAELEQFAAAGIGGVEITPIYGVRGAESRDIAFLSPRWVEMLAHTTREARRLGLGVDMATGTGWPFGGPTVRAEDGSSVLALADGRLAGKPTAMKVKRAAPGGEGLVLDPYSRGALGRYLEPFTRALEPLPRGALRSQFHDSFEYYNAGWTPGFDGEFARQHGYDLQPFAAALLGEKPLDADTLGRIKGDYRRTLARLHLDYVNDWVAWSHARGSLARNQAHGAPGNLLDLYAASDIPETESFGATLVPIAGLRTGPEEVNPDPDPPLNLIGRFASSAAHVTGKPLASSESLTWLRENFRESPAAAKPQLDRLFIAGINHIFYHGATYSPPDAAWPGWFFYAASQINPRNPLWRDYAAMNEYVTRVQTVLQGGRHDNDLLVYWPFDDLSDDSQGLMRQYGMHDNAWLKESATGRLALALLGRGHSFDFISDAQLETLRVEDHQVVAAGGRYRAIVVPAARRMAVPTLARLRDLLKAGVPVVFESLPQDVPGYARLEPRRAELRALLADPVFAAASTGGSSTNEKSAVSTPLALAALDRLDLRREPAATLGLAFIRRARADGFDYFLVNLGGAAFDGWLPLGTPAAAAELVDPRSGRAGAAALRPGAGERASVYLQLASGESALLRTQLTPAAPARGRGAPAWRYVAPASRGVELTGEWRIEFLAGGPALPAPAAMSTLASWTQLAQPEAQAFSGTARYRLTFDAPTRHGEVEWLLDLGDVRESARVRLNGADVGTAWSLPFSLRLGTALRRRGNVLEIEVTNLPANRVRDLDRRKVEWKIMKDINLASLRYRALDAATWEPAPSGLLGPVRLVPLEVVSPR